MRGIRVDIPLLLAVLALVAVGVVIVYSASAVKASNAAYTQHNWEYFFLRQAVFALMGIVVLLAASVIPYSFWRKAAPLVLLAAVLLLAAILAAGLSQGRGAEHKGAVRWLDLGPISVQGSEVAKLAVVFYLARYLAARGEELRDHPWSALRPLAVVGIVLLLILLEPDIGTTVFLGGVSLLLLFLAGCRVRVLAVAGLILCLLAGAAVAGNPNRMQRMKTFLAGPTVAREEADRSSRTQLDQSLMAIGSGRLMGVGLGGGASKLLFLPEAHTDFILAVVGEEMGLAGVLGILGLFALVVRRGLAIARAASDSFGMLLATGISLLLGLQAFGNAMVVVGLAPTKGISLPLVSYGGSSLLVSLAAAGILLNIAARREA